jgi:hypothetical protein
MFAKVVEEVGGKVGSNAGDVTVTAAAKRLREPLLQAKTEQLIKWVVLLSLNGLLHATGGERCKPSSSG